MIFAACCRRWREVRSSGGSLFSHDPRSTRNRPANDAAVPRRRRTGPPLIRRDLQNLARNHRQCFVPGRCIDLCGCGFRRTARGWAIFRECTNLPNLSGVCHDETPRLRTISSCWRAMQPPAVWNLSKCGRRLSHDRRKLLRPRHTHPVLTHCSKRDFRFE